MREFFERTLTRTRWSWHGIRDSWVNEHSFRYWVYANVMSGVLAIWLLEGAEVALILALGVLVLAAEAFNTAMERAVDLVTQEHHELAGRAKDAASGAVMLTAIAVGVAWIAVLIF
ncbi:MAG: diacylglycerol kinase [Pseudomonadota bacterium]